MAQITKFEHYMRESARDQLDNFDLAVILRFSEGDHSDLTEKEEAEAVKLIKDKEINIQLLCMVYYQKGGPRQYNIYTRAVWRCLSNKQWNLLERYYRSFYKEPANEEGDK